MTVTLEAVHNTPRALPRNDPGRVPRYVIWALRLAAGAGISLVAALSVLSACWIVIALQLSL